MQKTDRELIDEWLAENEPTKCPPAYLVPVQRQFLGHEGSDAVRNKMASSEFRSWTTTHG